MAKNKQKTYTDTHKKYCNTKKIWSFRRILAAALFCETQQKGGNYERRKDKDE